MADNQASGIGLKNYLSADDIDKPRFKSPGKLSSNLLGQFDSNPNLASSSKPDTRLSRSTPHLLQGDTESPSKHTSCNSDNSGARKHAGAHITICEPEVISSPSNNEEELLSNSEMVEEKDKKRRKRWKWSPWKKMRKIFGRKKDKRAKSCEDLTSTIEHASYKSNEEDSGRDSLRKRTKSEPTLSDARLKKIGLAVADVHHAKAAGGDVGGGSMLNELKKRHPGEGSQELDADTAEEAVVWPPSELRWITSQPSAQEAGVSFEETPSRLMLVGLQSAHDKIKAAPKNRRPPTRTNSGEKKVAPMKPHRKSKTNPPQLEQIKKPAIGEINDRPELKSTDQSRVVFESLESKNDKETDQEELCKVDRSEEKKNAGGDETDVKVNEKAKAKPLLPPVLKPVLPKEPEKASDVILMPSETEKPADTEGKCGEGDSAKTPEEKEQRDDSREEVMNSVREKANQILSATPGSPKLTSKSSRASPKASPRLSPRPGVALKPAPQSRLKWRDEKNKVSDALDDAFDIMETSEGKEPEKPEKPEVKPKEDNVTRSPVHPPRPAPRPTIAIKPKLPQKLPDDKSKVADALDDAFNALETEKTKPEKKEKEPKPSGSPVPAPRRALKPTPKSRRKLRGEPSTDDESTGDTSILLQTKETTVEKVKDNENKTEINQTSEKEKIVLKNANSPKDKESEKDKSARMIVLRSKSDAQMKIITDVGIKERALIFSSAESDQKKSVEIAPDVPLRPVKSKQSDHEKENDVGVQLRNKQFLVRDTDNRKTCPPKLLASLKLTGVESKDGSEQEPPWVALANKKTKRLSQIMEPEKTAQTNESGKEESTPSVQSKASSKPSVTSKPLEKIDFKPSSATVENKAPLSRSTSAGQAIIQKEKSKSLTRASSEDKPSALEKQGKHGFVPPKLEKCVVCDRTVYQTERCNFDNSVLHRGCIRCTVCKRSLAVGNFVMSDSKVYCKNHVQQTVAAC